MSGNRVKRSVINGQLKIVSALRRFNPELNYLIFADPRGGSTWLTEALATIPKTAVLWEPLHLNYCDVFRKINFGWRQFIPKEAYWPEAKVAFNLILSGKILNCDLAFLSSPIDYFKADHLILKFCRGNALLPWLTKNYSFEKKPVFLIRHPFAVACSQIQQGGWDKEFKKFDIPNTPFNEFYYKHEGFLKSLTTKEEALVASWCLSTLIPLKDSDNDKSWITVYYEDLYLNRKREISRIFQEWNIPIPEELDVQLRKPSKTVVTDVSAYNQLEKWKIFFSNDQIKRMLLVLEYFEVKEYGEEYLPKRNSL